jgi:iron complex outermembrane receptor protein
MEVQTRLGPCVVYWGVQADNLFRQRYRDYLNRMRYYADDLDINVRLTARVEF